MTPSMSYQQWQVERPKTSAENYAADVRRGMFAAAMSRSARHAARTTIRAASMSLQLLAAAVRLGAADPADCSFHQDSPKPDHCTGAELDLTAGPVRV